MKNYCICKNWAIYSLVLLFLLNCSSPLKKEDDKIHIVSIRQAIVDKSEMYLSEFIDDDIEYVQLESKKECLVGKNMRLYLDDSLIITFANKQIYLFDRKTGKFVREISHSDRSPQGYNETIYSFPYDEGRNTVFAKGWEPNSFYEYKLNGNLISKKIPLSEDESINSIVSLTDTSYIGYVWNYDGKQKNKLILFDDHGNKLKVYPQNLSFEFDINLHGIEILHWEGWFYKFDNKPNFFERLTDTIFQVTHEYLTPRYILSNGEFDAPYEIRNTEKYKNESHNYYHIQTIFESGKYLFFTFIFQKNKYCGIYDKESKETVVSEYNDGIKNDLDNFVPVKFYSINNSGEIIGFQESYLIKQWFKKNPDIVAKLPSHLQKFKNIEETDNPVVMIAKLKD